jgi:hypothetical protein
MGEDVLRWLAKKEGRPGKSFVHEEEPQYSCEF